MKTRFPAQILLCLLAAALGSPGAGCGQQPGSNRSNRSNNGPEQQAMGTGALLGQIVEAGSDEGLSGAQVKVGTASTESDWQGYYRLDQVPAGPASVEVTAPWFTDVTIEVDIPQDGEAVLDAPMEVKPLLLVETDKEIADRYNENFDWTRDQISVRTIAPPLRRKIDAAIYHQNPVLYVSAASSASVWPDPQPSSSDLSAFAFPIPEGEAPAACPSEGSQALVSDSIVDSAAQAFDAQALELALEWGPAIVGYLMPDGPEEGRGTYCVGLAVEAQTWGEQPGDAPAQTIKQLFLHQGELWVKVVFAQWLELGAGITDTDNDQHKEIYAKIASEFYDESIVTKLFSDYATATFAGTLELVDYMGKILLAFYGRTNPEYQSVIGVPFEVPQYGTLEHPFAVFRHNTGVQNVLLIGP